MGDTKVLFAAEKDAVVCSRKADAPARPRRGASNVPRTLWGRESSWSSTTPRE